MASLSTFFFLLSLLLLSSTEAEARIFPGMSFNNELIVVNIGGRISDLAPPSSPKPVKEVTTSPSIFEMMFDIIGWIMNSSAPAPMVTFPTEQQQVVDSDETANPSTSSDLFSPTPPVQQSSPSLQANPVIPPPPHDQVHPPPMIPSIISPSLQATPNIPHPPHDQVHPPMIPSIISPSLQANLVIPPTPKDQAHPPPMIPSIILEVMINGISALVPISMTSHPQIDHLPVS